MICYFFFFNDTATTEIYTLSLHDALPIYFELSSPDFLSNLWNQLTCALVILTTVISSIGLLVGGIGDRKSTRLNSSHGYISYAVFCLKKKNTQYSLYFSRH